MTFAQFHAEHARAERAADIAAHAAYIRRCGAEPWAVYRCDKLRRGQRPANEVAVAVRTTPGEAMTLANSLKRRFPEASFVVGAY